MRAKAHTRFRRYRARQSADCLCLYIVVRAVRLPTLGRAYLMTMTWTGRLDERGDAAGVYHSARGDIDRCWPDVGA